MLDVVIVGGSVAGLSAALYLGRSRRRVIVFDTGEPCNRFSHASHGFLTRDHILPADLLQIAREQLARYPTVQLRTGRVVGIEGSAGNFEVSTEDGTSVTARRVLLATGIRDELPAIPGIEPLWGRSVFSCPYCDGWEQSDKAVAIQVKGNHAMHLATLVRNLTPDLVICSNGDAELSDEDRARLARNGVRLIETPIAHLTSDGENLREIVFADGTTLPRQALFIAPKMHQHSPLAQALGCATNEAGLVQVDELGKTSVAGIYAAGDMATQARQVILAAKNGAFAGSGINADLCQEEFA